jgi:predicted phosphate transport protein (TIGR00153 family)
LKPGLLRRILPREKSFFQMFNQQAENVEAGAIAMVEMLEHFDQAAAGAEQVEAFEHTGDSITHSIIRKLNQTFVTPFDREDIHELASKIDDVIDLVDAAATRMVTYRVRALRPGVLDLAITVRLAAKQIVAAVRLLDRGNGVLDHCIEINRLENLADRQCRDLIVNLFEQEKDPVEIIKWKEIIETLEFATDKCEDVANVIETVTLKNA